MKLDYRDDWKETLNGKFTYAFVAYDPKKGNEISFLKIGTSIVPPERLKGVQTGCPLPLHLLAEEEDLGEAERDALRRLKRYKVGGGKDWYHPHPTVWNFISANLTPAKLVEPAEEKPKPKNKLQMLNKWLGIRKFVTEITCNRILVEYPSVLFYGKDILFIDTFTNQEIKAVINTFRPGAGGVAWTYFWNQKVEPSIEQMKKELGHKRLILFGGGDGPWDYTNFTEILVTPTFEDFLGKTSDIYNKQQNSGKWNTYIRYRSRMNQSAHTLSFLMSESLYKNREQIYHQGIELAEDLLIRTINRR